MFKRGNFCGLTRNKMQKGIHDLSFSVSEFV